MTNKSALGMMSRDTHVTGEVPLEREAVLGEVTLLLHQWGEGEKHALEALLPLVYDQLRARAQKIFNAEQVEPVLQATALVNEVYLKLSREGGFPVENRAHFFAIASRIMRRILVEHARKRNTRKRGGGGTLTLDESRDDLSLPSGLDQETLLTLDGAINRLEQTAPRAARVLELKIFADLENGEIAAVMNLSPATVKREWALARQRLFLILTREGLGWSGHQPMA